MGILYNPHLGSIYSLYPIIILSLHGGQLGGIITGGAQAVPDAVGGGVLLGV
jgi:hypothetical protein